jgi:hypothetical protein
VACCEVVGWEILEAQELVAAAATIFGALVFFMPPAFLEVDVVIVDKKYKSG